MPSGIVPSGKVQNVYLNRGSMNFTNKHLHAIYHTRGIFMLKLICVLIICAKILHCSLHVHWILKVAAITDFFLQRQVYMPKPCNFCKLQLLDWHLPCS